MFEDSYLDTYHEDRAELAFGGYDPEPEPYDGGGWPGDGSGCDDLADYNQNESDDYANEGACDDYEWDGPAEDAYIDACCD